MGHVALLVAAGIVVGLPRNVKGPRENLAGPTHLLVDSACTPLPYRREGPVFRLRLRGRLLCDAHEESGAPILSGADARRVLGQEVARATGGVVRVSHGPSRRAGLCDFRHSPAAETAGRAQSCTGMRRAGTAPPHAGTTTEANQHGQGRAHEERSSHQVGSFLLTQAASKWVDAHRLSLLAKAVGSVPE